MKTATEQGYTIIELMVVVIVLATIMAIAAPSFSNIIGRNKVVAATNELTALLHYAKAQAVANNVPLFVCPLSEITTTTGKCDLMGDFSKGKIGIGDYNNLTELSNITWVIDVPKGVKIINKSSGSVGKIIAFMPDNSAAIHGIGSTYSFYNQDGSVANIALDQAYFATGANQIKWQISNGNDTANAYCLTVTAVGQSAVTKGPCDDKI